MNGIHDLGGMDGFTLPERDQDFPLREQWERQVVGAGFVLRVPGVAGGLRRRLERMPPHLYLTYPYYAKWLYAREEMLIESGLVTREELDNPDGPVARPDLPPDFRPATAAEVVGALSSDTSELLDADVAPRYAAGAAVRARNEHPRGHTRMPRYVRGRRGTIAKLHGPHRFEDELPEGVDIGPQHLYTVAFDARELWGARGHPKDTIHVELWELHLEPA
jgi:nitrile hydratase beta subunit